MIRFVSIFFVLVFCDVVCGDWQIVESDDFRSAVGFNTDRGFFSAGHVDWLPATRVYVDRDVRLCPIRQRHKYRVGSGEPAYFYDRRGTRHKMTIHRTEKMRWLVSVVFFSGESGSPVFNENGHVVGLVVGNVLGVRRLGIVARLDNCPGIAEDLKP